VVDAKPALVREVVELGVAPHEARWLVDEFATGGLASARPAVLAAAQRRLNGEPLQYIIGHWPFRELDLDVDRRALIPRPETEFLVELALRAFGADSAAPLIMDLGCGTGAIALSLVSELINRGVRPSAIAVDRSDDALALARQNARKCKIDAVSFVQSDWYDSLDATLHGRVDLIVANPPYVAMREYQSGDPVLRHEPLRAIVADDDVVPGFRDVAAVISGASQWLKPGGTLLVEHGEAHGNAAVQGATRAGLVDASTKRDLAGRDRYLEARRP
jgi:release factor glutamine methyltransferase